MNDLDLALREATKALDNVDDTLQQISNVLIDGTPDAEERRRYALLQAAVMMMRWIPIEEPFRPRLAVDWAEAVLAEIEKREKAEAES